ncbi:MAG: LuxR C-terminal-related transcriptional regulator [Pseudomonadota bacterium]
MDHRSIGYGRYSTQQRGASDTLHIVDQSSDRRAEIAKLGEQLGYRCTPYADLSELIARPPRRGTILTHAARGQDGVRGIADRLRQFGMWLAIIAYDEEPSPARVVEAAKAGALDFLNFPIDPTRLERCLDRIERQADRYSADQRRQVAAQSRIERLSPREREVLDYLSEGNSNKMIARELNISPRTVEIHRAKMMTKIGANHAAEAVRIRIESGIALSEYS